MNVWYVCLFMCESIVCRCVSVCKCICMSMFIACMNACMHSVCRCGYSGIVCRCAHVFMYGV